MIILEPKLDAIKEFVRLLDNPDFYAYVWRVGVTVAEPKRTLRILGKKEPIGAIDDSGEITWHSPEHDGIGSEPSFEVKK